jgi:ubiquinone biosynthesis protein
MRLFRLIKIIYITLKYSLDELILAHSKVSGLRQFFKVALFFRNKKQSRGERLRLALERLGPIFVKFGQMLSTRRDLIPLDIADELAKLQDQVPPFDFEIAKHIIEKTYDEPLNQVFSQFDEAPIASASVAQVHFAHLPDGRAVAVKILRPGIAKVIRKDIKLLESAAWLIEMLLSDGKRLRPREVVEDFSQHINNELDLLLEAASCSQLKRNFPNSHLLIVPEVYWDWCHEQVMVMERMNGTPVSQVQRLRDMGIDIPKLARDGVEIFFTQVFRDGFFHADMHPGNIQVAHDGRYIALDFGIMGTLTEIDKQYLARNFVAFFRRDYREVAQAHIESGWVPSDVDIDQFENAIRSVCEPIFNKPLKDISFARVLIRLFHTARRFGLIIQPQLTMLQKTLMNVEGLGRDLDPNLDLWQTAKPYLERWMSEQIGWRSIFKKFKEEAPMWGAMLPTLPRKIDAFLKQDQQHLISLQLEVDRLKTAHNKQKRLSNILFAMVIAISVAAVWRLIQ